MMPVALIAARRCGVVAWPSSAAARASTASAVDVLGSAAASGIREYLLAHAGGGAAQAICHQRQRMRFQPADNRLVFQQLGDRGNALQQILLGFRCHSLPFLQPRFRPAVHDIRAKQSAR